MGCGCGWDAFSTKAKLIMLQQRRVLFSFFALLVQIHCQSVGNFPRFTRCLINGTLTGNGDAGVRYSADCITCSSTITVIQGRDSEECVPRRGNNLSGRTCTELDPVLESIMLGHTMSRDCIEIVVARHTTNNRYVVQVKDMSINQSLVIRSSSEVCEDIVI